MVGPAEKEVVWFLRPRHFYQHRPCLEKVEAEVVHTGLSGYKLCWIEAEVVRTGLFGLFGWELCLAEAWTIWSVRACASHGGGKYGPL